MTLAISTRRWNLRLSRLSAVADPSPLERLCRHEVWVRKNCDLVCKTCGKLS